MGWSLEGPVTPRAKRQESRIGRTSQGMYVHAYRCEDVMEYAVDIYWWKKSLEASYLPGDWTITQTEVTPHMRATLLSWLGQVIRRLDFS